MAKEIERKFLVDKAAVEGVIRSGDYVGVRDIAQYYVVSSKELAVRMRLDEGADHAVLAVKAGGDGMSVDEFEFKTLVSEYEERKREMVGVEIRKTRYEIDFGGRTWEVDFFHDAFDGLVVAEIEAADAAGITTLPDWVGKEVTYDARYKNAVLAIRGSVAPEPD